MKQYYGKAVYRGITKGEILLLKKHDEQVEINTIDDTVAEIDRFIKARDKASAQLAELYDKALKESGKSIAAIFEIHRMMLFDKKFVETVQNKITNDKVNAEYAVAKTSADYEAMFSDMDDEYMKSRAADVKDISERVVSILRKGDNKKLTLNKPAIVVAKDLTPSEIICLDKEKIQALVTLHGSVNSHTAMIARMMNIPALTGVDIDMESIEDGMPAIVDSYFDTLIIDPSFEQIEETESRMIEEHDKEKLLETLKGVENITLSGKRIDVYANIDHISDLIYVQENDAAGIGLFRSEYLYLGRDDFPSEDEQYTAYCKILSAMDGKRVVIRTLDIGADKIADYFNLDEEKNPALGYRAIRICLKQKAIFKTQLRALLRASVSGNLSVMYPMITSVEEVMQIKEIVNEVKGELESEGIPYKVPEQGVMIETPASVMISDELAEIVDFFSIGTNDLTQYTLAIDRQNEKLDTFFNPHHKAILKMIRMVVDNAHKSGKRVGICGELAADLELTEQFINMGVDELSAAPSEILRIRKVIRNIK